MIEWHQQLPSTMDEAHRRAREGAPHGTAIAAREQRAGRGRRGRAWSSPDGGVWMSVICRPSAVVGLECLSLRSGLAVAQGLERMLPGLGPLTVKWPNDVLLDGRKLAGILCESRWDGPRLGWVVVGVGINVSNSIPDQLSHTAIRLADRVTPIPLDQLAEVVRLGVTSAGRWAGLLTEGEMAEFARRDMLVGRAVTAPIAGWAAGITPAGSLRIRTEAGLTREVTAGDAVALA